MDHNYIYVRRYDFFMQKYTKYAENTAVAALRIPLDVINKVEVLSN